MFVIWTPEDCRCLTEGVKVVLGLERRLLETSGTPEEDEDFSQTANKRIKMTWLRPASVDCPKRLNSLKILKVVANTKKYYCKSRNWLKGVKNEKDNKKF